MTNTTVASMPNRRQLYLFLLFFGVTVILQVLSGAYHAEFAGYPDESAHYVTSVMVRDFIAGLHYFEPIAFAKNYYEHYPKVAFGHWPPLFYALAGPWMLLFSPARTSVLIGMAILTALFASFTAHVIEKHSGRSLGLLAGLLLICLPLVQLYSDEVMAESLLAVVSLLAAMYFSRYLTGGRWQDSAMFGFYASLAILTKGNGWDLAFIPPIALLLTRKYSVLTRWSLWLSAAIVIAMCAPWQWMTFRLAQRGWTGGDQPSVAYTARALWDFIPLFTGILGWGLTVVAILGIVVSIVIPYFKTKVDTDLACIFALIPATWIFHSIVPAGVESRKLIIAVPAMILFLFAGGAWLTRRLRWQPKVVVSTLAAVFALTGFSTPRELHYGYIEAARFIQERQDLQQMKILVSSNRDGEGMLISELVMSETRPTHQILRGTKVLARTDWDGRVYDRPYRTSDSLLAYLHEAGIGLVVSDNFQGIFSFEHQKLLKETIAQHPERFQLLAQFQGDVPGEIHVYRVN